MSNKKIFIFLIIFAGFFLFGKFFVRAAEPLIYANNLEYLGAFRVPSGDFGSPLWSGFNYGGTAIAHNPANNSLFMVGVYYFLAEPDWEFLAMGAAQAISPWTASPYRVNLEIFTATIQLRVTKGLTPTPIPRTFGLTM